MLLWRVGLLRLLLLLLLLHLRRLVNDNICGNSHGNAAHPALPVDVLDAHLRMENQFNDGWPLKIENKVRSSDLTELRARAYVSLNCFRLFVFPLSGLILTTRCF